MVSRERPAPALDDDPPEATAAALADAAEAEAVAAEAEARAAAARAHALRLQRQATEAGESIDTSEHTDAPSRHRWLGRPKRKNVAVGATIALICTSLVASGYLVQQHHSAAQQRQRSAEFAAAARQAIVAFMSLDFDKTGEDMQRIADISTGHFKDRFPAVADELTKRLQQSKVVTTATVNDVAVESMTDNSATVLLAVTTSAKMPDGTEQPQSWHIALGLTNDGGRPKMSNIEFVP